MTIIDADTGEVVSRVPAIAAPGTPTTPELIAHQCRALDVWSETCGSIPELKDAADKLTAIGAYLARIDSEGRAKVAASRLRIERRIGELLGPAKRGGDRTSEQVDRDPLADALTKEQRRDFRKMADHPDIVDDVIDESDDASPASRRKTLDEINRARQAALVDPPEPKPNPSADAVAVINRAVDEMRGLDGDPDRQERVERRTWEYALRFIADHPNDKRMTEVALAALRTETVNFERTYQ